MTKNLLPLTIGALVCALSLPAFAEEGKIADVRADHELSRLAFGSCLRNPSGAEILDKVVTYEPDLFVWLGDNIYVDTMTKVERLDQLYGRLGDNPRFQQLRKTCPQLAIWDDHDYGADNHDKTYPLKKESKTAFGRFWQVSEDSALWEREGIYRAVEFGNPGRRVQVILLDGRWFLDKQNRGAKDSYLGKEQWAWLGEALKRPAEVRVICSGVQVIKLNAMGNKASILTPDPLRVEIVMAIQPSTQKSERALGQA